ncbi:hypothetical protein OB919_16490 [Halobacteria archaeon AArc-curdl1]|uniref:SnoaL-like domain-containing protein n=1 Tax=Natronosalvus hydrolyticus TaxID=2979988 RepID=A0AAP2ZAX9_9EURY|nr:hypothetical protein [Halobacteria archaeon AArc-curdl1]
MSSQSSSDTLPLEVVFAFYAACNKSATDTITRLLTVDATWVDREVNGSRTYQGRSAVCERSMRSPDAGESNPQTVPTSIDRVSDAEIVVRGRILEGRRETPFTDRIDVDDGHIRGVVRERGSRRSEPETDQRSGSATNQQSRLETDQQSESPTRGERGHGVK